MSQPATTCFASSAQDYSVREWKKQGAPGQKIMVGMPMYGRSFTLKNTSMFDIGSEVMGGGKAGRYTQEEGFMAYYEVCASHQG